MSTVESVPFGSTLSGPALRRPLRPTPGGLDHLVLPLAQAPPLSPTAGPDIPGRPTALPPPAAPPIPTRGPRAGLPLGPPSDPGTLLALPPCQSQVPWALHCLSTASSPSRTRPEDRSSATDGRRRPRARQAPSAVAPSPSTSSTLRAFPAQSRHRSSGLRAPSSGWTWRRPACSGTEWPPAGLGAPSSPSPLPGSPPTWSPLLSPLAMLTPLADGFRPFCGLCGGLRL